MSDRLSQASFGGAAAALVTARSQSLAARPGPRRRPSRRLSQRLKRDLVGGSFFAVTGLIAAVLCLISPPRPAALVLVGADYAENLAVPDNALGWNGLTEVAQLADTERPGGLFPSWRARKMTCAQKSPEPLISAAAWKSGCRDLGPSPTVVIYVDLHGDADKEGPYLLADHARLEERVRLTEVLAFLREDRELRDKNKLLILDVTKLEAHEPLTLHNDFARRLLEMDKRDDIKGNLVIICASGPNQRSWVSAEWRKSIFAQKVIEGLRGGAAKNKRVTALGLYDYVKKEVRQWAANNRGAVQEPLLLPSNGGRELAARMELALADESPAPPAPGSPPPPAWLVTAWEDHDRLLKANPPPYLYAPHLWQEYREALLRCESLATAGRDDADPAVAHLLKRLTTLGSAVREAGRPVVGPSARNNLAIAAALGSSPAPEPAALLAKAWAGYASPDADARARADGELRQWVREHGQDPLDRVAAYGWLYRRVADGGPADLAANLSRARGLGEVVGGAGNDRPAEALFLAMLAARLPPEVWQQDRGALVLQALRVRRLAEEAALGAPRPGPQMPAGLSECLAAPAREKIDAADHKRRLAEDHLFAGANELTEAEALFTAAEKEYRQVAEDLAAERLARSVSARVHADLPCYARWLTRSRGGAQKDLVEAARRLWDAVHALDERVGGGPAAAGAPARPLTQQALEVEKALLEIKDRFDKERDALLAPAVARQAETWRRLDDLLAVPLIEAGKRKGLLTRRADIADVLNRGTGAEGASRAAPAAGADDEAAEAAWRREQLALAALGAVRFDQGWPQGGVTFKRALEQRAGALHWEKELAPVSWQVADLLRALPKEIDRLATSAQQDQSKPDGALEELLRAEPACRLAPGGLVAADAPNPVALRRRWQTHDLLHWLARRTLLDRWWSERGDEPYFKSAGTDYLRDAGQLLGNGDAAFLRDRRGADGKLQALLNRRPDYRFTAPDDAGEEGRPIHVAAAREMTVDLSLSVTLPLPPGYQVPQGRPVGVVAVRREPAGLGGTAAAARAKWAGHEVGAEQRPVPVPLTVEHPGSLALTLGREFKPKAPVTYEPTWHGLFRGCEFERRAKVVVHPAPDSVVSQLPGLNVAGVAVTPDDDLRDWLKKRRNILIIVLDLTGSMKEGRVEDGSTRKEAAIKALDAILADLDERVGSGEAPPVVGVITFGQDSKQGKNNQYEFDTAEDSIKVQWEPAPWGKGDRKKLVGRLTELDPFHKSPIARAIRTSLDEFKKAEKQLDKAGPEVVKTLLVLTDGQDNRFEEDEKLPGKARGATIRDYLGRQFERANVGMHMVVINADKEKDKDGKTEKDHAREQFEALVTKDLRPAGTYFDGDIRDARALARALREAMRLQPDYHLHKGEALAVPLNPPPEAGWRDLAISTPPDWRYYYFEPGTYRLGTLLDPGMRQSVELRPGEVLRLKLSQDRGFRRALVSEETKYERCPRASGGGWRLTALQHTLEWDSWHFLTLALEAEPGPGRAADRLIDRVEQLRPEAVWFEVSGGGNGISWQEQRGSVAPIWRVGIPRGDWARVKEVKAWVSDRSPRQFAERVFPEQRAPLALKPWKESEPIKVGKRPVRVRASVEKHDVVNALGEPLPAHPCLVVRAEYDTDAPVRAWLPSADPTQFGAEHHYYAAGDRGIYAGVFWFLDGKKPEDWAPELYLLSVEELRARGRELSIPREKLNETTDAANSGELERLENLKKEFPKVGKREPGRDRGGDGR